jgi:hypothetical protein
MLGADDTTRLAAAARLLMADLAFAQTDSITHADDACVVVFDQATSSYTLARSSSPTTPITNPADGQPYVTQFGVARAAELAGVTIAGYSLDGDDRLRFGAYGQLDQTAAASVTLQSGAETLTVQIDPYSGEAYVTGLPDATYRRPRPVRPSVRPRLRSRLASISGPGPYHPS